MKQPAARVFSSLLVLLGIAVVGAGVWHWQRHTDSSPATPAGREEQTAVDLTAASVLAEDTTYELLVREGDTGHADAYFVRNKQTGRVVVLSGTDDISREVVARLFTDTAGMYVAIDQGTSVSRGIEVFSLKDGGFLGSFCSVGTPALWRDYGIYRSCFNDLDLAGWEAGLPNIEAIDMRTGATTTLLTDRIGNEYFFYQNPLISGDILSVKKQATKMGAEGWLELVPGSETTVTNDLSASLPN